MRNTLKSFLSALLLFTQIGYAENFDVRNQKRKAMEVSLKTLDQAFKAKTVKGVLDYTKKYLNSNIYEFLLSKAKGYEAQKVKVTKIGKANYLIMANGTSVSLKINQEDESFLINNKSYVLDLNKPVEQVWNEILALMPNSSNENALYHLVVPQVHAEPLTFIAGSLVVLGVGYTIRAIYACNNFKEYLESCRYYSRRNFRISNIPDTLREADEMYGKRSTYKPFCQEPAEDMRACYDRWLKEQPEEAKKLPPYILRAYGIDVAPTPSTSDKTTDQGAG